MNDRAPLLQDCPSRNQLLCLLRDEHQSPSVEQHVRDCATCARTIANISHDFTCWTRFEGLLGRPAAGTETLAGMDRVRELIGTDWSASERLPAIEGYEVSELVGRGGGAVVYRARQRQPPRDVAIKMLAPALQNDDRAQARFRAEVTAVANLNHPGIVPIYEVGAWEGRIFFTMPLIKGGSLASQLAGRPVESNLAARIVSELADAVAAAHAAQIVHRDLKPANVLVEQATLPHATVGEALESATFKISDFGIAKHFGNAETLTRTGDMVGTPEYMAPEQVQGDATAIGPATDIYGLGAVLYELLTGRPPLTGPSAAQTILQVSHNPPTPPAKLLSRKPHDLDAVCLRCLEKKPSNRYASAAELANDLQRFLSGEPTTARPMTPPQRLWKWALRRPYAAGLYAVTVVGLLALLILWASFTWQLKHQRDTVKATVAQLEVEKAFAIENFDRAHVAIKRYLAAVRSDFRFGTHDLLPIQKALLLSGVEFYDDLLRTGRSSNTMRAGEASLEQVRLERAQLLMELGKVYFAEGSPGDAVSTLDRAEKSCLEVECANSIPVSNDFAQLLGAISISQVTAFKSLGRIEEAVAAADRALRIFDELGTRGALDPAYHRWYLAQSWHRLGGLRQLAGDSAGAQDAFEKAVNFADQLPPISDFSWTRANCYRSKGRHARQLQLWEPARTDLKQAVDIIESVCRKAVPRLARYDHARARCLLEMAKLHRDTGEIQQAESTWQRAINAQTELYNSQTSVPELGTELAEMHRGYALLLSRGGKHEQAAKARRTAEAIQLEQQGPDAPAAVSRSLQQKIDEGDAAWAQNRHAVAIAQYKEAVDLVDSLSADELYATIRQRRVELVYRLAQVLYAEMDYAQALKYFRALAATEPLDDQTSTQFAVALSETDQVDEALSRVVGFDWSQAQENLEAASVAIVYLNAAFSASANPAQRKGRLSTGTALLRTGVARRADLSARHIRRLGMALLRSAELVADRRQPIDEIDEDFEDWAKDEAISCLQEAGIQANSADSRFLPTDRRWQLVRNDERFLRIVAELNSMP